MVDRRKTLLGLELLILGLAIGLTVYDMRKWPCVDKVQEGICRIEKQLPCSIKNKLRISSLLISVVAHLLLLWKYEMVRESPSARIETSWVTELISSIWATTTAALAYYSCPANTWGVLFSLMFVGWGWSIETTLRLKTPLGLAMSAFAITDGYIFELAKENPLVLCAAVLPIGLYSLLQRFSVWFSLDEEALPLSTTTNQAPPLSTPSGDLLLISAAGTMDYPDLVRENVKLIQQLLKDHKAGDWNSCYGAYEKLGPLLQQEQVVRATLYVQPTEEQ